MCENFDCDGSVSHYPFVYELCSELLSVKFIAMDFLANIEKGNGITTIWNSAVEMFPYEFNALSQICDSLAKCGDPCHQFVCIFVIFIFNIYKYCQWLIEIVSNKMH